MTPDIRQPAPPLCDDSSKKLTVLVCMGIVAGMVGLAFVAAPLYSLFCKLTGFGGVPLVDTAAINVPVGSHKVKVRFDANVAPGLAWRFVPETPEITVRVGAVTTASYRIENTGTAPATGIASYNVQPDIAGGYFVKIACFCFTDTTLQPGESREETVVFYVDPAIAEDVDGKAIPSITLSYTFFRPKNGTMAATPET